MDRAWRLTGLLALLGAGPARAEGGECARFCETTLPPGPGRGQCASEAAHGQGLCYECGPAAPGGRELCGTVCCQANQSCCGDVCASLATDPANCGACGTACPAGVECVAGACSGCPEGSAFCAGACINILTDPQNCGGCGRVCPPDPNGAVACVRGTCV